jgi:uncharacterized protein (DUF58 family)
VLQWYGATSEVAWLFLLSAWIFAFVVVAVGYAWWNSAGLRMHLRLAGSRPAPGSPVEELPEQLLRTSPTVWPIFERDGLDIEVGLDVRGLPRGPAWVSGRIGTAEVDAGTGLVPKDGWRQVHAIQGLARGPVGSTGWELGSSDPLGFVRMRKTVADADIALVLPRFTSLSNRRQTRELEASVAAPRAGSGSELFGVREYRSGDSLRRIHWRSSARHGELVVREYEPPGVQTVGIFVDPSPPSVEVADQIARLAASEAWDCIRDGGRVVLWGPGLEPSEPSRARSMWDVLEWLALYPGRAEQADPPMVGEAVMVTAGMNEELVDALESARRRGARARAWVVGDADLDIDITVQRVGTRWPL